MMGRGIGRGYRANAIGIIRNFALLGIACGILVRLVEGKRILIRARIRVDYYGRLTVGWRNLVIGGILLKQVRYLVSPRWLSRATIRNWPILQQFGRDEQLNC